MDRQLLDIHHALRRFSVGWQLLPVLDVCKPFCCCGSQNCQLTFEISELQLPRRSQATWEHFPTSALEFHISLHISLFGLEHFPPHQRWTTRVVNRQGKPVPATGLRERQQCPLPVAGVMTPRRVARGAEQRSAGGSFFNDCWNLQHMRSTGSGQSAKLDADNLLQPSLSHVPLPFTRLSPQLNAPRPAVANLAERRGRQRAKAQRGLPARKKEAYGPAAVIDGYN